MGSGAWSSMSFVSDMASRGVSVDTLCAANVNEFYKARCLNKDLDPYGVKIRECRDSDEHPNTIPIILALDVTGSMGSACAAVAKKLDEIMTSLYDKIADVEFMVMGIGDFSYDDSPLQVSQFESDIRILDQLSHIYFERGGGGNGWESYTAAWYFASRHTDLDCWKRGQKGIIITLGDEPLNPYLPAKYLKEVTGDHNIQGDIETKDLYEEVTEKYDVYHVVITDKAASAAHYMPRIDKSFGQYLDGQHLIKSKSDDLPQVITDIVMNRDFAPAVVATPLQIDADGIGW